MGAGQGRDLRELLLRAAQRHLVGGGRCCERRGLAASAAELGKHTGILLGPYSKQGHNLWKPSSRQSASAVNLSCLKTFGQSICESFESHLSPDTFLASP